MMLQNKCYSGLGAIVLILSLVHVKFSSSESMQANLELNVVGDGFHRLFFYRIHIEKFIRDDCHIALSLNVPSTLYVNIDELTDLKRLDGITACSLGEIDVEISAEDAKPQQVTLCARLVNETNILHFKLHQRYQKARNKQKYVNVTLPNPKILLGCKKRIKQYPVSKMDICETCAELEYKWREIIYEMKTEPYTWTIPVGESSESKFVTCMTLFACALGTIYAAKFLR